MHENIALLLLKNCMSFSHTIWKMQIFEVTQPKHCDERSYLVR